jgi:nucleoside-diphosphate-sugar epimerase
LLRILLTGATGFIGSHVARELVRGEYEVHALIRPGSDTGRIADVLGSLRAAPCDLFSHADVARQVEEIRPDLCIHLAWCAEPGTYLESPKNLDFLASTLHLAEKAAASGARRFVSIGTCFEYDADYGLVAETTPTSPSSLYAASKLATYLTLDQLGKLRGMEVVWPRIFHLYGPGENEKRLVPYLVSSLLRDQEARLTAGNHVRDYLHVEDVASAIRAVAESGITGPVNVGSGRPVAVREVANLVGDLLERRHLISCDFQGGAAGPAILCANNRLLLKRTNWSPKYQDLRHGLESAIGWWRART